VFRWQSDALVQVSSVTFSDDRSYVGMVIVDVDNNGKLDVCIPANADVMCAEWDSATSTLANKMGSATTPWATANGEIRGMASGDVRRAGQEQRRRCRQCAAVPGRAALTRSGGRAGRS
jgi:hypothetical protein